MGTFWNKDIKRIILVMALTWIVGGVFTNLAIFRYQKRVSEAEYNAYANILSVVKEAYPQAQEDEIIRNLSHVSEASTGESILRQYGILKDGELYLGQSKVKREVVLWANGIFFVTMSASVVLLFLFWKGRNRKLRELGRYVDRVSHGEYELQLQKNQEDELSGLRNELYKLTVLYKEQADGAQAGKVALADSVANISHQLKTPLTSAVILTDNLLESPDMPKETRVKFLQEISRQLVGMKWLVISMLKLSRLDAGVVELQKERVSLKKIAEDSIGHLEMMAQFKEIHFETRLEEVSVTGDVKWLSEALQNIVKNAIEHSPQGGAIEIETSENEVYCQVSVRDHGKGISDLDQKHLFERFYHASKVENENVGIGLALAKEVVERQNGSITVESGENGTCFYIRILKYSV
ncbi:MAG: HAMP domain-containing histidine kinase [Acetatifactor sp.]|nr:HAMP domain-containing histidine kinase [Acetatifactor sp.]